MQFLRRSLVGIFLISATLALLAWAGMTVSGAVSDRMSQEPRAFPQRERVLTVNVVQVTPGAVVPELVTFGDLRARRTLALRATVGGTVIAVHPALTNGGTVKAGELILSLDRAEAEATLNRVRANLADAEAELRDADRGLSLVRDELVAAEDQVALRQTAATRAADLQARGVGTAAAVEAADLALSAAQAAVLSRRQSLAQAEARRDQADTSLARARIDLAEADRTLAQTQVFAQFDGTFATVTALPGGRLSSNEQFAELIDPSDLEVSFRLSTAQYARLLSADGSLPELPVTVSLDVSGIDIRATGRIVRESAAVGAGQTGRELFAAIETTPGFRPGDFVTVRVAEPALTDVALVPAAAVAADGTVLALGPEDRLEAVPVEVLRRQDDDVIIAAAPVAGRQIVAERTPLLGAGIKVKPNVPGPEAGLVPEPVLPETVKLDDDRRARLVAFVEGSRMPDDAKARILAQLQEDEVPAETVARIESRMGG